MSYQKRLRIERKMTPATAAVVAELVGDCPGGPTMTIQRGDSDNESIVFFSKRTYAYLEQKLRDMKREGKI